MYRIFVVIFALVILSGCKPPEIQKKEVMRSIAWTKVKTSSFEQVRRLSGTVESVEEAKLSFQVNGKVKEVIAKLGQEVKIGDVLARLDSRIYLLNQESSYAQLQKSQSQLVEASNQFERFKELGEQSLVSKTDFDSAQAKYKTAQSSVALAKTQLDISNKDMQDTILLAPYSGKITNRFIEPAMQVNIGQTAFEIEGKDGLELQVLVPDTLLANVNYGKQFAIHFPVLANAMSYGVVTEIGSKAQTANAFPVTLLIQSPTADLRAGMSAEVEFIFEGVGQTGFVGKVMRLPLSALVAGADKTVFVFVYNEQTKGVEKRVIQVENILNNEVLVSSGLKPGEVIATAGVHSLRDGQRVKLFNKNVKQFN